MQKCDLDHINKSIVLGRLVAVVFPECTGARTGMYAGKELGPMQTVASLKARTAAHDGNADGATHPQATDDIDDNASDPTVNSDCEPVESSIQVIFVEDDDFYRQAVEAELASEGLVVHAFKDSKSMLAAVASGLQADVVVLGLDLESRPGIDLLSQMRERA